jgi:adenosylcobinamide-phosphate guanylyltransferase
LIAVIMCGGMASRMQASLEKPLLRVCGVPMIELVVSALLSSDRFDRIVAAVSPHTPKTKDFLRSINIDIVETEGDGYSKDLSRLLSRLRPRKVAVVSADLPLLDAQVVSHVVDAASHKKEPAVSIVLEKEFVEKIGVKPSVVFGQYCHSGITIFDTAEIPDEIVQESYVVMNRKEIALNVNTKEELELAEKLLIQRA